MEYVDDGGFYVRKSERDNGKSIPYCPLCFKSDGKVVPLNPGTNSGRYSCSIHESSHTTAAGYEGKYSARVIR